MVLVTTKRGRVGRAEISFKANVGLNYLRKTNEFLEADDYLYYLRLASYRSGNIAALSAAGPFGTATSSRQTATSRPRVSTARCSSPTRTPICSSRATRA